MNPDQISRAIKGGNHPTDELVRIIAETLPSDQREVILGMRCQNLTLKVTLENALKEVL